KASVYQISQANTPVVITLAESSATCARRSDGSRRPHCEATSACLPRTTPVAYLFLVRRNARAMEHTQQLAPRRWPVMFCCAIITPLCRRVAVGGAVASRYIWPHPGGYTLVNIVFAFVAAEILLTWGLVVCDWICGERPRWLALFGPVLSIWSVWHIFFA